MVERFEEGLRRFKDSEEKATLLRLHVRFLKYRMATRAPETAVWRMFQVGMEMESHAGSLRGGAGAERAGVPAVSGVRVRVWGGGAAGGGGVVGGGRG